MSGALERNPGEHLASSKTMQKYRSKTIMVFSKMSGDFFCYFVSPWLILLAWYPAHSLVGAGGDWTWVSFPEIMAPLAWDTASVGYASSAG